MFHNIHNTFTKNKTEILHLDPSISDEEANKKVESFFTSIIIDQDDSSFKAIYGLSKDEFFHKYGFIPGEEFHTENDSTSQNEKDLKDKIILKAQLNAKIANIKSMMSMGSAFPLTKEEYLVNMKNDLNNLIEELNSLDVINDLNSLTS